MSERYDAVIIGGGAVGTACAYYLSKSGASVALIEKKDFSEGTSSKCEGHLAVHDTEAGYFSQISKISLDLYRDEVIPDLELDVHYETMGIGLLCENEYEVDYAKEIIEGKRKEGISVEFLDQRELLHQEPYLAKDVLGAAIYECDSKLNPMYLCRGLAEKARSLGAQLFTHREATGIETDRSGRVCGVATDQGTLLAENVVDACGVLAPHVGEMAGVTIPIVPRQGEILVTEKTPIRVASRSYSEVGYVAAKKGKTRDTVTKEMEQYGVALVIEGTADDNYLLGSSRIFSGYDPSVHHEITRAIAQRAMRFFPILAELNIIRTYSGLRPSTPDGCPIVSDTDVKGFYVAAGHEGNGICLAPFTGKAIASMIAGTEPVGISLDPLTLHRFNR